jgi:hypothetical protein
VAVERMGISGTLDKGAGSDKTDRGEKEPYRLLQLRGTEDISAIDALARIARPSNARGSPLCRQD